MKVSKSTLIVFGLLLFTAIAIYFLTSNFPISLSYQKAINIFVLIALLIYFVPIGKRKK